MDKNDLFMYVPVQISKGFWRIEDNGVRMFLVEGKYKTMLVDTGYSLGNIKKLVESLSPVPVFLVNTHADRDHIGGNKFFKETYMGKNEIPSYIGTTRAIPVSAGHIFDLGGMKFEVLEAPGHTPGSIMLLDRDNRTLISGDSINMSPIFMFGEKRNLAVYIQTLERLHKMSDSFDNIWPSHGPCPVGTQIIEELITGARKLLDGELIGMVPPRDLPCKLYEYRNARFLY